MRKAKFLNPRSDAHWDHEPINACDFLCHPTGGVSVRFLGSLKGNQRLRSGPTLHIYVLSRQQEQTVKPLRVRGSRHGKTHRAVGGGNGGAGVGPICEQ